MTKQLNPKEAARRLHEFRVSQTRERLVKKIVEPALIKHDYDFYHPEVVSARRVVDATLARIFSPPSMPLPMETVLRIGQGHINEQGHLEPPSGFVERENEPEE